MRQYPPSQTYRTGALFPTLDPLGQRAPEMFSQITRDLYGRNLIVEGSERVVQSDGNMFATPPYSSWREAQLYASWLNRQRGIDAAQQPDGSLLMGRRAAGQARRRANRLGQATIQVLYSDGTVGPVQVQIDRVDPGARMANLRRMARTTRDSGHRAARRARVSRVDRGYGYNR